jgi:hypothetical protein
MRMSVSKEYGEAIAKYAEELWAYFTDEAKMWRTNTKSIEDAEKRFSQANAADKHTYTLPR